MHVTIAGVQKKGRNGHTRIKELGSIDELKHGKVFRDCGGTRCVYIEKNDITNSCAIILNTEKTLSTASDSLLFEDYEIYRKTDRKVQRDVKKRHTQAIGRV